MSNAMSPLVLRLAGPVELTGPGGETLTPRGMRARAALAIMGTARCHKVMRARLQDLIYSERGEEQGAASVRQLLREIRIALDGHREALVTGPGWVGLDKNSVRVDTTPRMGPDGQRLEFAADLDVADPEFEDWLREARAHHENQPIPAEPEAESDLPKLIVQMPIAGDPQSSVLAAMILNEAVARAADVMPIDVIHGDPGLAQLGSGMELGVLAARTDAALQLFFTAKARRDGRVLWSRRFGLPDGDTARMIQTVAGNVTIAILHGLQSFDAAQPSGAMRRPPIEDVFSYSSKRLARAEQMLSTMDAGPSQPIVLALRSYIRNTMLLERLSPEPQADAELADELAIRARELAPGNATVLAVNSLIAAWKSEPDVAYEMARQARMIDADNPMVRLALSTGLTSVGRHKEAEAEASSADELSLSTLGPAAWYLRRAIAALRSGDMPTAERHFAATHGFAPENRPALRFISAVRFQRGDLEGAQKSLLELKKIEPDFSLDLMASDDYPVKSLRDAGLLGVTKSGLI
ncbi:SARP family transcriptional regulator (plasmid) [Paracoccus sp. TK19116]|uniref:SARP family transcriptional regulator n=1 Tax=Paracoccus albicereus TaxID=2922394 RepID=A0ABT1MPL9_9RHOB|nr:SARP family transcriptional regulator [Paracoccus albicereus]MCQ0969348.1 SARP family transcriptional regulator [Paracoccus albicereus]